MAEFKVRQPPRSESAIKVVRSIPKDTARIIIEGYGSDITAKVKRAMEELRSTGSKIIHLYLDLQDPAVYEHTDELENLGFFFAGIIPCELQGDALILQFLDNIRIDYDPIQAYSQAAKRILSYIRDRDPVN